MPFRKFKADHLFTGKEFLQDSNVLIANEHGEIDAIVRELDAGENIEVFEGILCPGFINAHCHLELSHMKGAIPERTGLVDFVYKVVTERHFSDDEISGAITIGEREMLNNGIVAAGDICNNLSTLKEKKQHKLSYYNFIEASGWAPSVCNIRFERAKEFYNAFIQQYSTTTIVPHSPYSVSEDLWQAIIPYYSERVVSIHNQETEHEDEYFIKGTGDLERMYKMMNIDTSFYAPAGKSSLQSCFTKLSTAKSVILVHNTFTKQADIGFVKDNTINGNIVSFCLCINANLYIENAIPPVDLLLKNNCNIIIGTDSLASNHQLSILEELKTIAKHFPHIELSSMLQWSTFNGARALQMDNMLGSFEKGKKPGIVLIENTNGLELIEETKVMRLL
jgi:aminodeoxyfutalosine deaminase